jgi:hypothetical protein
MKKFLKLILVSVVFSFQIFAQNYTKNQLDSLFNRFVALNTYNVNRAKLLSVREKPVKCLTSLAVEVVRNFNNFTSYQQSILKPLTERPSLNTSVITPQRHFKIHYDSAGYNAPTYSVPELAEALDSAYNFEINYLGYPPPPSDDTAGGDSLYDVYVTSAFGGYGCTTPEIFTGETCTTYMKIRNDFSDSLIYRTLGINAARVTVAHEFHHAIQMGEYVYRYADRYFHELTSTSMEEFVFNTINDYYQYLGNYFNQPSRCFAENRVDENNDGYDLAIWNIFQKEKFGFGIIKREWELMKEHRAIEAIDMALKEQNTTFIEQYNVFGLWCYFTNIRSVPGSYFPDAANYPLIIPGLNCQMYSSLNLDMNAYVASNNYINIINVPRLDTLMMLITNGDVQKAIDNTNSTETFSFGLYNTNQTGAVQISPAYYAKLSLAANPYFWSLGGILNNKILDGNSETGHPKIEYVYPSPFNYKKNSMIYFPITNLEAGVVDLYVYSSSMKLVYSSSQQVTKYLNNKIIHWNAFDKDGNKLPTGVYIYAIKTADETLKGKFVIIK